MKKIHPKSGKKRNYLKEKNRHRRNQPLNTLWWRNKWYLLVGIQVGVVGEHVGRRGHPARLQLYLLSLLPVVEDSTAQPVNSKEFPNHQCDLGPSPQSKNHACTNFLHLKCTCRLSRHGPSPQEKPGLLFRGSLSTVQSTRHPLSSTNVKCWATLPVLGFQMFTVSSLLCSSKTSDRLSVQIFGSVGGEI